MIAPVLQPRPEPWLRGPVAVVVSRFPKISETFILREITEMERQGQAVRLVTLIRERQEVIHPDARPWLERLLHVPFASPAVARAQLRLLLRRPRVWAGMVARLVAGSWRRPVFAVKTLLVFFQATALAERLRAEGIEHVHAHFATFPATAAWTIRELTGIEFSFTVHAHDLFVHQLLLREKLVAARFVRVISALARQRLIEVAPESAGKIELVRLGVDPARYAAAPFAEAGEPPLLLTIASLEEYKGLDVLVEACAELARRGVRLRAAIVGRGRLRGELGRTIDGHGLTEAVRLLGPRTEDEVAELLRHAAVVVQPSVVARSGQMEGIPVALMEAMAAARPVVASRLSRIPELVEDGRHGWLVPPGDAHALAGALAAALGDPAEAERRGRAGRERVREAYDLTASVAALLERLDVELEPHDRRELLSAAGLSGRASLRVEQSRADSAVRRILIPGGGNGRELIEKRHRARAGESAPPPARAAREYALLAELDRLPGGPLGAPRPLALDAERGTLLMEALAGEPLDVRIRRLRGGALGSLLDDLRRAGEWLAGFQLRFSGQGDRAARLERIVDEIGSSLSLAGGVPTYAAERIASRAAQLARLAAREPARLVRTHGDFWPGNLFVDGPRVSVIDFEGAASGLAEEDAADFLVELRLFFLRPGGRTRFAAAARAFLSGYGARPAAALELALKRSALVRLVHGGALCPRPVRPLRRRALIALARGEEPWT